MTLILLLFAAGAVLLAAEIFLPGAIAGIVGALFLLGGVAYSFAHYGADAGWIAALCAVAMVGLAIWLEFWLLPRTPWGRRFFLAAEVSSISQPAPAGAVSLVGQRGRALSPLFPTGNVEIAGRTYEAFCQDGSAAAGAEVLVVGQDNFRIIITTKLPS